MTTTSTPRTAQVGDEIPTFERFADFPAWNRYAAVNDEFVPIHMDDDARLRLVEEVRITKRSQVVTETIRDELRRETIDIDEERDPGSP